MMKKGNACVKWLIQRRFVMADAVLLLTLVLCLVYVGRNGYQYDRKVSRTMEVESPWLVKSDREGSQYLLDSEKSRILKVSDQKLQTVIHGGAPSGDTFFSADNICIADNGDVYVLEISWSTTGLNISGESILRYDKSGVPKGICYQVDYENVYCDKHRLFGMEMKGENLYFVSADEKGFSLHELNTNTLEDRICSTYRMEDAITLIQDFVIDTENRDIYGIDKRGNLLYAKENNPTITTLYCLKDDPRLRSPEGANGSAEQGKIAMYRGSMGKNGTVYATDIASDQLLKFAPENQYQMETVLTGPGMWNASYQELNNGKQQISYVSDGQIHRADADGSGKESIDRLEKSLGYGALEVLYDLSYLLAIVAGAYLILRMTGIFLTISYSSTQKIGAMIILTVISVSVILIYGLMGEFEGIYRDELLMKLNMTSQIVSNSLEEEELDAAETPQNYMGEDYRKLWEKMDAIVDKTYSYSADIYCNILRFDGQEGYAITYLDNSIGTYYPLLEEETLEVKEVYETGQVLQSDTQSETGSYIYVMTPVFNDKSQVIGVVSIGTLSSVIDGKIGSMTKSVAIAMVMIVLTIMFLFGEVLSFFDLKDKYRMARERLSAPIPMHVVRVTVFITFMGFNMATSFLPVYIMKFVHGGMGIPSALVNSLPITLNLVFVGLTSVLCPKIINKLGFSKLAVVSGGIALCGDLCMAAANSYGMIIAGLVLNGIGVGFITNSIQIFIASISADEENQNGFSIFNAASLSGINCGMLFGSALAERMGQGNVFFVSACAWGIVAAVFALVGKSFVMKQSEPSASGKKKSMVRFIASPNVLKFMICIQVPYIIMNSFTYYYVPIFGANMGYSENITSLLIITCSLCSVYLSVAATDYFTKKFNEGAIYMSSVITFVGLLFFAWKMTLPTLIVALVLIGIANSFGSATRISCFIRMKESEEFGEDNAMGSYNLVDNIGESTGSIIFAGIISVGFRTGILGLIGSIAGLNSLYIFTKKKSKNHKNTL